jgi:hypothetical protein
MNINNQKKNIIEGFNEATNNDNISFGSQIPPKVTKPNATKIQEISQRPARRIFLLMIPTTTEYSGEYIPIHVAIQRFLLSPENREPPYYEVPTLGILPTVRHAYAEWYFGINGNPAIVSCMKKYGKEWERKNQQRLSRRKILIHEIELRETDFSTEEVLEILEILRDGCTLNKLIDVKLLGHDK